MTVAAVSNYGHNFTFFSAFVIILLSAAEVAPAEVILKPHSSRGCAFVVRWLDDNIAEDATHCFNPKGRICKVNDAELS